MSNKIRKAWMRRNRRALEGRGYRRETVETGSDESGRVFTRTYILKNDGRKLVETKVAGKFKIVR